MNYITKGIKTISTFAKFKTPLLTLLKTFILAPLLSDERQKASCIRALHFITFEDLNVNQPPR